MIVPPAAAGTHEDLIAAGTTSPSLFVFPDDRDGPWLSDWRGHRAIGVVYHPERDRFGNWVPTLMGDRYDALLSFGDTTALHAIPAAGTGDATEPGRPLRSDHSGPSPPRSRLWGVGGEQAELKKA
jgi:erythromycin esterase